MKDMYGDSWNIYLTEQLEKYGIEDPAEFIKKNKLSEPTTTLRQTIDTIAKVATKPSIEDDTRREKLSKEEVEHDLMYNWIIYRSDGYLKTLLFAEKSAVTSLRSFLRYKYSKELSGEALEQKVSAEMKKLLMYVHVHEDIDPDKADSGYGSPEAATIIKELGDRGYLLNEYSENNEMSEDELVRIIMSTKGTSKDEYDKTAAGAHTVKTDKWSQTYEHMLRFLNGRDAMIVNLDRDHFFFLQTSSTSLCFQASLVRTLQWAGHWHSLI